MVRLFSATELTPLRIDDFVMKTEGRKDSQEGLEGCRRSFFSRIRSFFTSTVAYTPSPSSPDVGG